MKLCNILGYVVLALIALTAIGHGFSAYNNELTEADAMVCFFSEFLQVLCFIVVKMVEEMHSQYE